jgi:hypothetical protein
MPQHRHAGHGQLVGTLRTEREEGRAQNFFVDQTHNQQQWESAVEKSRRRETIAEAGLREKSGGQPEIRLRLLSAQIPVFVLVFQITTNTLRVLFGLGRSLGSLSEESRKIFTLPV